MTEEQKQALIEWCGKISEWREKYGDYANVMLPAVEAQQIAQIALATLTATPVKVDDSMALAFHKALNDGGVGHEDLEEIKVGLEAALCNIPRPAPAADLSAMVPPGWKLVPVEPTPEMLEEIWLDERFKEVAMKRRYYALLAAAPAPPE